MTVKDLVLMSLSLMQYIVSISDVIILFKFYYCVPNNKSQLKWQFLIFVSQFYLSCYSLPFGTLN